MDTEPPMESDPIAQFQHWFAEAVAAGEAEPTAMTVATASAGGTPSARMVLMKDVDARGVVFFTNYRSRKGRELAEDAPAALVVPWPVVDRQACVDGVVGKLALAESDAYVAARL